MKKNDVLLRQQHLLAHSAKLRLEMIELIDGCKKPLDFADGVRACLQWLYQNPLLPLGSLLVLVILRPRRVISWSGRALWVWTTFHRAKKWIYALKS